MSDDEFVEAQLAAWQEFEAGFRPSQKGNLWREYDGLTVTVFRHREGSYGWSIADGDEVSYSSRKYGDQECAMMALFEALGW